MLKDFLIICSVSNVRCLFAFYSDVHQMNLGNCSVALLSPFAKYVIQKCQFLILPAIDFGTIEHLKKVKQYCKYIQ